jgi:heme/copper-type cytochrome/quinol oxidase subunit 4
MLAFAVFGTKEIIVYIVVVVIIVVGVIWFLSRGRSNKG